MSRKRPLTESEWKAIASAINDTGVALTRILPLLCHRLPVNRVDQIIKRFDRITRDLRGECENLAHKDGHDGIKLMWDRASAPHGWPATDNQLPEP